MKHFLVNNAGEILKTFEEYNPNAIKAAIVDYLRDNPDDEVEHSKEFTPHQKRTLAGDMETLNFYEVNPKNGKVSRIVTVGHKTVYRSIE